jgi:hypothetical protein
MLLPSQCRCQRNDSLPHSTGKTARLAVFAVGEKAEQAIVAGADVVGFPDFDAASPPPTRRSRWAGSPACSARPQHLIDGCAP